MPQQQSTNHLDCADTVDTLAGKFFPVEQAPEDPAEAFEKGNVDRAPSKSPIENIPLDQTSDPIRSKPKNLVLILREDDVGDLANSLQMFAPKGSTVTVISKEKPEVTELLMMHTDCFLCALTLFCLPAMWLTLQSVPTGSLLNCQSSARRSCGRAAADAYSL